MPAPTPLEIKNALIGLRDSAGIAPLGNNLDVVAALLYLQLQSGGSGGGSVSVTNSFALDTTAQSVRDRLPATLGTKTASVSLPVTLSSDGTFATAFGSATDTVAGSDTASTGFISLVKYLLTRITSLFQGVAGAPNTNVISVQGIASGTALSVSQSSNAVTTSVTFTASATSSTFTIANRLGLIVCPAITGAPTLTLQVTLDGGTTWTSTSVTLATDASLPKAIEADSLAKVSGAFGLANAFRLSSSASITASLSVRSITQ